MGFGLCERRERGIGRPVHSIVCKSSLERIDNQLFHLHERIRHPLRLLFIGISQPFAQDGGNDLPGQAEPVFQPAAGTFFAAFCQSIPVMVDLLLDGTANLKGDGFVEMEMWTYSARSDLVQAPIGVSLPRSAPQFSRGGRPRRPPGYGRRRFPFASLRFAPGPPGSDGQPPPPPQSR